MPPSIWARAEADDDATELEAWIDTGFTGELVLSLDQIAALALPQSAVVTAELADGTSTTLDLYSSLIEWFGHVRRIEVIASMGATSLLGVALLDGHTLTIDSAARTQTID